MICFSIVYVIFILFVLSLLYLDEYDFFDNQFRNTYEYNNYTTDQLNFNNTILPDGFNTNWKDLVLNTTLNNNLLNNISNNGIDMNSINNTNTNKGSIDPLLYRDKVNGIKDMYINKPIIYQDKTTGVTNVFAPQVKYEGTDIPTRFEFN